MRESSCPLSTFCIMRDLYLDDQLSIGCRVSSSIIAGKAYISQFFTCLIQQHYSILSWVLEPPIHGWIIEPAVHSRFTSHELHYICIKNLIYATRGITLESPNIKKKKGLISIHMASYHVSTFPWNGLSLFFFGQRGETHTYNNTFDLFPYIYFLFFFNQHLCL